MSVPPELVGAWRRVGLTLDGVRHVDYCDVIWLQTPKWFADIRLRLVPDRSIPSDGVPDWLYAEAAFAGLAHWSAPRMTWEHVIDYNRGVPQGSNLLRRADGVLMEQGVTTIAGLEAPFSEEWLRMTGDDVVCAVDCQDGQCRVEVGGWAIELRDERPHGPFSAIRYEAAGDAWTPTGCLPAGVAAVEAP